MEAPNSVLRLRVERTSAQRSKPAVHRLATLLNAAQIERSDGRRKGMTVNTAILICWLIFLIVVLAALELHIRSLTVHSSLLKFVSPAKNGVSSKSFILLASPDGIWNP
jgi:hypothetical protein